MVSRVCCVALLAALVISSGFAQTLSSVPIVVAPSGQWSGSDGPWSTFNLGVGEPFQAFQGVPGINFHSFLLPGPNDTCSDTTCPGRHTFRNEDSASWRTGGLYDIPMPYFYSEMMRDKSVEYQRGQWGTDSVYLGNSARDVSSEIWLMTLGDPSFTVASFGLVSGALGPQGATKPTLLQILSTQGDIPGNSYSYTAGSAKRNSSGSLILGGYDTSRFDPNTTVSLAMPSIQNTSLIVQVNSITLSGPSQRVWTPEGEALFIVDSTLTQMWLPLEACKAFEDAFGIVWNETAQLYLLNDTTRANLQQLNPVVNITIRESEQRSVTFTFPYTAFDLTATAPLVDGSSSPYFPLKRASGLFVLGRVFLQETYISIDYDRARFNISQAYPQGGSTRVMTILPPSNTMSNGTASDTDSAPPTKPTALSSSAIAGIAVSVAVISAVGIGLLLAWRKRWGFFDRDAPGQEREPVGKAEMDGEAKPWVEVMSSERAELVAVEQSQEVNGVGCGRRVAELEGSSAYRELGTERASG